MKRILYFLILLSCIPAFGQDGLRFVLNPDNPSARLYYTYGDSLRYQVTLMNTDSVAYNGPLYAGFTNGLGTNTDSVFISNVQIGSGDSLPVNISIPVTPQGFKTGPEVVVVWPIINATKGLDFIDFIFVQTPLGNIDNVSGLEEPIVNGSVLWFRNYANNDAKRVRIMNSMGALVYDSVESSASMELPSLAKGLYFAEVSSTGNKTAVLRFIR